MAAVVDVYRAKVDPANAERLLEVRPRAIEEFRRALPELLRAELIRLDTETWLDVLVWSEPVADERVAAAASKSPSAAEMHALVREVVAVERGELAATSAAA